MARWIYQSCTFIYVTFSGGGGGGALAGWMDDAALNCAVVTYGNTETEREREAASEPPRESTLGLDSCVGFQGESGLKDKTVDSKAS